MILHANANSTVKLDRMYVDKIHFSRTPNEITGDNLRVQFTKSYDFNSEHTSCTVSLGCTIKSVGEELINLETSIVGHFSCDDASIERRDVLLQKNTLAILFPYLRSQISLITAQPGLSPIVLPPMNIDKAFDDAVEK